MIYMLNIAKHIPANNNLYDAIINTETKEFIVLKRKKVIVPEIISYNKSFHAPEAFLKEQAKYIEANKSFIERELKLETKDIDNTAYRNIIDYHDKIEIDGQTYNKTNKIRYKKKYYDVLILNDSLINILFTIKTESTSTHIIAHIPSVFSKNKQGNIASYLTKGLRYSKLEHTLIRGPVGSYNAFNVFSTPVNITEEVYNITHNRINRCRNELKDAVIYWNDTILRNNIHYVEHQSIIDKTILNDIDSNTIDKIIYKHINKIYARIMKNFKFKKIAKYIENTANSTDYLSHDIFATYLLLHLGQENISKVIDSLENIYITIARDIIEPKSIANLIQEQPEKKYILGNLVSSLYRRINDSKLYAQLEELKFKNADEVTDRILTALRI